MANWFKIDNQHRIDMDLVRMYGAEDEYCITFYFGEGDFEEIEFDPDEEGFDAFDVLKRLDEFMGVDKQDGPVKNLMSYEEVRYASR